VTAISITGSESFRARLRRNEQWRATIMASVWALSICTFSIRRALGGPVASVDFIFQTSLAIFSFGVLFHAATIIAARRATKAGAPIADWRWHASAVVDLLIPTAAMTLLVLRSPTGPFASLSAPVLLAFPLVIFLSILRLRPIASLMTGIAAALAHATLVVVVIVRTDLDHHYWAIAFNYSVILLVSGVVAAFLATQARAVVHEAVGEAVTALHAKSALQAIRRDLDLAREIQQGLMPGAAPALARFDIAGMARPADQTGGDYYDWQPLPDGRLAVVLADVTGHGIGPALVMAVCRAYARASAPTAAQPGKLLQIVNTLIERDLPPGRFITMVIALVHDDGTIHLASAGHGPTLLYRAATRTVQWFGGQGLPLGVDPNESYDSADPILLQPGDVLMLLTDGFMEWSALNSKEQFGLERLQAALAAAAHLPARDILSSVDGAVQKFAGGAPQLDDTTAVAIKRL
jgi:serine phosphatase RsbU (regulator of sigma subunit)